MTRPLHMLLCLGQTIWLFSCGIDLEADPSGHEAIAASRERIIAGDWRITDSLVDPAYHLVAAAGRLDLPQGSFCTATLISDHLVLSAAHCTQYTSYPSPKAPLGFTVNLTQKNTYKTGITGYRAFGTAPRENDVLLVRLDRRVPRSLVKPVPIATSVPPNGAMVITLGYGCNKYPVGGSGIKRGGIRTWFGFSDQDTTTVCPGDSGGPTVNGFNGPTPELLAVTSGFSSCASYDRSPDGCSNDPDCQWLDCKKQCWPVHMPVTLACQTSTARPTLLVVGNPVAMRSAIEAQAQAWDKQLGQLPFDTTVGQCDDFSNDASACDFRSDCRFDMCVARCSSRLTADPCKNPVKIPDAGVADAQISDSDAGLLDTEDKDAGPSTPSASATDAARLSSTSDSTLDRPDITPALSAIDAGVQNPDAQTIEADMGFSNENESKRFADDTNCSVTQVDLWRSFLGIYSRIVACFAMVLFGYRRWRSKVLAIRRKVLLAH